MPLGSLGKVGSCRCCGCLWKGDGAWFTGKAKDQDAQLRSPSGSFHTYFSGTTSMDEHAEV